APAVADQFEATVVCMGDHDLIPGLAYRLKSQSKETRVSVTALKHRLDVTNGAQLAARTLALNEIGVVNLATAGPIAFEPYAVNRTLGGFILIDPLTFETVGAGMIAFALRRSSNIHWQALE